MLEADSSSSSDSDSDSDSSDSSFSDSSYSSNSSSEDESVADRRCRSTSPRHRHSTSPRRRRARSPNTPPRPKGGRRDNSRSISLDISSPLTLFRGWCWIGWKNTRFAINDFTSIGLGVITEEMKEYLNVSLWATFFLVVLRY